MDPAAAAQRWADTWEREWPARNLEAILALYDPGVTYTAEPFREPYRDIGELRAYLEGAFAEEDELRAWFAEPVVTGHRASIAWWATLVEAGVLTTLVGTSTLRFDAAGLAVAQWDTWNQAGGWLEPPEGWGR